MNYYVRMRQGTKIVGERGPYASRAAAIQWAQDYADRTGKRVTVEAEGRRRNPETFPPAAAFEGSPKHGKITEGTWTAGAWTLVLERREDWYDKDVTVYLGLDVIHDGVKLDEVWVQRGPSGASVYSGPDYGAAEWESPRSAQLHTTWAEVYDAAARVAAAAAAKASRASLPIAPYPPLRSFAEGSYARTIKSAKGDSLRHYEQKASPAVLRKEAEMARKRLADHLEWIERIPNEVPSHIFAAPYPEGWSDSVPAFNIYLYPSGRLRIALEDRVDRPAWVDEMHPSVEAAYNAARAFYERYAPTKEIADMEPYQRPSVREWRAQTLPPLEAA